MNPVVEALALLTPYDIDKPKIRLGPPADGGYIFVDDITPDQAIVSYGISTEYSFDAEMAAKGHHVYMFDHTIDGIVATNERMHFFREGVAGVSDPAASLYSIEDHLSRHAITGDRLILKMDVEGAEFAALNAVPERILARFAQITLAVHGLHLMEDFTYREQFCTVFRKLNRLFTLFHVHANNCDGPNGFYIVGGLPVSGIMELSYVRTSTVKPFRSRTLYPTSLDYPNVGEKDKLLWFFPFLPTLANLQSFIACPERVDRQRRENGHDQSASPVTAPKVINVALGKPASQSSLSQWSTEGEAARAVSGTMPYPYAFHTDIEDRPWWMVDLLGTFVIETIVVHNRLDMCRERARTLVVEISEDDRSWVVVHAGLAFFSGGSDGQPLVLTCASEVSARYVRLSLTEREYLHLAQVEILSRPEMLALEPFLRQHALTNLKPNAHPPKGIPDYFIEQGQGAKKETDPMKLTKQPLVGLKVYQLGRFGNVVLQYTNAILFAKRTGIKYVQLCNHELLTIRDSFSVGDMTFLPGQATLPEGYWLAGFFFFPTQLAPVLADNYHADEAERCHIAREVIRPHTLGWLASYRSDHDPREVTVHIRAGDVFAQGSVPGYRQPPLSFYTLVIKRLLTDGSVDRVRLIFQDRGNPCVDALEQFLLARDIPYRAQSATLEEDLAALIDAPHLVLGFGTFGHSVCRLSTRIETVHYFAPERCGCFGTMPVIGSVFSVHDRLGKYFQFHEWKNTQEQRDMMVSYPEQDLEIEDVTNWRGVKG